MISELLKINGTLTELNLNREKNKKERNEWLKWIWTDNRIRGGAGMISESLKTNSTLTKLELESNEIWNKLLCYKWYASNCWKTWF